ncbi:hypothetical protein ACRALDRAFT_2035393 [Sodiomyces alcalophilus JCM 7366]|uniref:uncharacterized protein n=1 Tax=Sodiomyces alcalophilus JCM 7366 TaxID=591952 RepID=UPI0039B62874
MAEKVEAASLCSMHLCAEAGNSGGRGTIRALRKEKKKERSSTGRPNALTAQRHARMVDGIGGRVAAES